VHGIYILSRHLMVECDVEQVKYEAELAELRTAVEGVLHELVVGKLTSAATRQACILGNFAMSKRDLWPRNRGFTAQEVQRCEDMDRDPFPHAMAVHSSNARTLTCWAEPCFNASVTVPCQALLPHVDALAAFLGRRECVDFLMPAIVTFLNDRSGWQLRAALFAHIGSIATEARTSMC